MKANRGKKKGGYPQSNRNNFPNQNIKSQNMKMQAGNQKSQRVVMRKGRM